MTRDFHVAADQERRTTSVPKEFVAQGGSIPKTEKESTELFRRLIEPLRCRGVQVLEQVRVNPRAETSTWGGAKCPVIDFVLVWPNWGGIDGDGKPVTFGVEIKRADYPLADVVEQAACYRGSTFKMPTTGEVLMVDWGAVFPCEVPGRSTEVMMHRAHLLQIEPRHSGIGIVIRRGVRRVYFGGSPSHYWLPKPYQPQRGHRKTAAKKTKKEQPA